MSDVRQVTEETLNLPPAQHKRLRLSMQLTYLAVKDFDEGRKAGKRPTREDDEQRMSEPTQTPSPARRFAPASILFAVLGLLLFAYFVKRAGVSDILSGLRRLGAGFVPVLIISGIRPFVRSLAWTQCFEAPNRLRLRDAFIAYLMGDALGNVVPLGIMVSEPTKVALVRDRVPLVAGLSAIAVENLFYSLSVALFIFTGTAALLFSFPLSEKLRIISFAMLTGLVLIILFAYFVIRQQWKFVSRTLEFLYVRGFGRRLLETRRARVSAIEDRIYGFYARNRQRFLPILFLEFCFHLAGVAEVYVTLYFISDTHPTWLAAFVLESVNRVINVVFKFVPMRVGVDEAGTGLFTKVLQFGTASGVALAIIRKARVLVWTAIGVVLLVRRGLSLRAIARDAQMNVATETAQRSIETESIPKVQ